MVKPTLHLNGSGKNRLQEQYLNAAMALSRAYEALCDCRPHGRDYYPQGDSAIKLAEVEHDGRMQRVREVLCELEALVEHTAD